MSFETEQAIQAYTDAQDRLKVAKEAVLAADLHRVRTDENVRMLARASLTEQDPEGMMRLTTAHDEATSARLALDRATIVANAAADAVKEAEHALELARKRDAAAEYRVQSAEFVAKCEAVEALSAELGKMVAECIAMEGQLHNVLTNRYGASRQSIWPDVRDKLRAQFKDFAQNSGASSNKVHGVADMARNKVEKHEREVFWTDQV